MSEALRGKLFSLVMVIFLPLVILWVTVYRLYTIIRLRFFTGGQTYRVTESAGERRG